jgi:hypothetical protein
VIAKITAGIFGVNSSIISKAKEKQNGRCNNNSSRGWDSFPLGAWYYYLAAPPEGN